jgi:nitroreductase
MELPLDSIGLLEGLTTTRAIRRFKPAPIPDTELAAIMFAATRAPSGSNRQPFRFLVLRDGPRAAEARQLLGRAFREAWATKRQVDGYGNDDPNAPRARLERSMQHFVDHFEEVPVVVLACLSRYRPPNPYEGNSVYPACQNLLLAARARGLGGVMTMWHAAVEDDLRRILEIPEDVVISATIPLGYPAGGGHGPVRRRPVSELIFDDLWGQPAPWASEPVGTRHTKAGPPVRAEEGA